MEYFRIITGVIFILFWIVYLGQLITVLNYKLAQKLGFQEPSNILDPVFQGDVKSVAVWDLIVLWTIPLTGVFMLINLDNWTVLGLISGSVYIDTGGRQLFKLYNFMKHQIKVGSASDIKNQNYFMSFLYFLV
jgi:hypothetical protein